MGSSKTFPDQGTQCYPTTEPTTTHISTSPEMDPAALEAIKTHMENILQNSMQDALTNLK